MTAQDPELSAALGWPGGISDPALDRTRLLQMVAALRLASKQALEAICGAKLCEVNSMSSRHEMVRLMDEAITVLRAALAQQAEPVEPVTTLTAQRGALLEALKEMRHKYGEYACSVCDHADAAIKAVEEGK